MVSATLWGFFVRFLRPNSNLKVEFHRPVVVDVVMVRLEWCYGPGKSNQRELEVRLENFYFFFESDAALGRVEVDYKCSVCILHSYSIRRVLVRHC